MSPDQVNSEAIKAMTQWVSAIADNIRNPIAGMTAALDIISRELSHLRETGACDDALIHDACQRMRSRFGTLCEYVSELVDFGRPLVLLPLRIPLRDFLAAVVYEQRQLFLPMRGLELGFEAADDMQEMTVSMDAQRMGTVLRALIRNGIEASMGQPSPCIKVTLARHHDERQAGRIAIHVDDNGPGFDRTLEERVFDPFFSTKEAGTGLGLSLARKYVAAHDGNVSLGRAPALGGARVTVTLPVAFSPLAPFDSF